MEGYVAMHTSLRFPPPLLDDVPDPADFEFNWRLMQCAFDLEDPMGFPPFSERLSEPDEMAVRRYIENARHLSHSTIHRVDVALTVHVRNHGSEEEVEYKGPSREVIESWAMAFRRCYGLDEYAGFRTVKDLLWKFAALQTDQHRDRRLNYLRSWGRAESRLRQKSVRRAATDTFFGGQSGDSLPNLDAATPQTTINEYFYGEYLHVDRAKADILDARKEDKLDDARHRFHFLVSTGGLAYLYIGFAVLARQAVAY